MMQPIATQQAADVEAMELPTFMKLALDPATMKTLATAYKVAMKNDSKGFELEYVKV